MKEPCISAVVNHSGCHAALINDDCLVAMKTLKSQSVDLIVCDLPYGVTQHEQDKKLPFEKLWKEYNRIIKDNGAILLFGQGKFFVELVNSNPKMYRYDLVWDKTLTTGFLNANRMPLRRHEQIAVFYKKLPVFNPQFTEGKPLHGRGTAYKNKEITNNNYGEFNAIDDVRKGETQKYPTSIISIPKSHPSVANHRTEKPVELLEWLIRSYSNTGAVVLDNCMGSGTACVAALKNKRNFIGIEKNCEIFAKAVKEIKSFAATDIEQPKGEI